jgi:transcriptional regulator with GAF, ATPase, and Fis domain
VGIFDKSPFDAESKAQRSSRLLRQLTHLLNEELDLNHFLITMLEGINRACDCDQSFILLFKGREQSMVLKQHLGTKSQALAQVAIRLLKDPSSPLHHALKQANPCWSEKEVLLQAMEYRDFVNRNLMVVPIKAMGKLLGFVFAIKTSKDDLSEGDFECFQHFADHASIAFRIFIGSRK